MNTETDLTKALARSLDDDPGALGRLHDHLAAAADAKGLLDIAYRTIDTPVGSLLLAATDLGLVRVAYASEDHDVVLQALAEVITPRILCWSGRLDETAREFDEYFAGRRHAFDIALDWRLAKGFRSTVLHALPSIGYGHTACATNPLPVVVPCHRVVRSDGAMGGYLGGVEAKRTLLSLESAA